MDDAGASGNHTKKADTLVELALKMKIDPRALVDTIERYNKFCETGKDLDFGKPAQMLQPIKKPPFYAIFGNRWSQSTKGRNGIAVNSRFQALNTKGEAMPGLYAAGDGCTIFGGLNLNKNNQGPMFTAGANARSSGVSAISVKSSGSAGAGASVVAMTASSTTGGQSNAQGGQGMPSGGQGGAPGAGGPGGASGGGVPMGMGGAQAIDFKTDEGNCCGGLGPAFLSGYYAGMYVADYLKNI